MTATYTDRDAFRGQWVKRGLVRIPVIPDPDADEIGEIVIGVLHRLRHRTRPFVVTGTACSDCGCLLAHADELCPACVRPWMYAQEKAWSERRPVVYYRTRKQVAA